MSLIDFIEFCKLRSRDEIYDMFEFDLSDDVRDFILSLADDNCNEPVRNALNELGKQFKVQTLIDY